MRMGVLGLTLILLEDVLLHEAKDTLEDTKNTALGVWVPHPAPKLHIICDAWAS